MSNPGFLICCGYESLIEDFIEKKNGHPDDFIDFMKANAIGFDPNDFMEKKYLPKLIENAKYKYKFN